MYIKIKKIYLSKRLNYYIAFITFNKSVEIQKFIDKCSYIENKIIAGNIIRLKYKTLYVFIKFLKWASIFLLPDSIKDEEDIDIFKEGIKLYIEELRNK